MSMALNKRTLICLAFCSCALCSWQHELHRTTYFSTRRLLDFWTGYPPSASMAIDVYDVTNSEVRVFREGWFQDSLLGKTEIPFLDIEEWSGASVVSPAFFFVFSKQLLRKNGAETPSWSKKTLLCKRARLLCVFPGVF